MVDLEVKRLQEKLACSRKRELVLSKMLFDLGVRLPSENANAGEGGAAEDQEMLTASSTSSATSTFTSPAPASLVNEEGEGEEDIRIDISRLHEDSTLAQDQERLLAKEHERSSKFEFEGVSFVKAAVDRGGWLAMLLVFQSFSTIILSRNVEFVKEHPTVLYFLTALVGAGGNAGNQAAVRCIRGLAQKKLNGDTMRSFLVREIWMAVVLAGLLGLVGLGRAYVSYSSRMEMIAIVVSLMGIVLVSVLLGAVLPLGLRGCGIDPAHASTLIQVVMDILGVWITIFVTALLLDPEFTNAVVGSWFGTGATQSPLTALAS